MNNTPFKAPLGASIGWYVRLSVCWSGGWSVCLTQILAKKSRNLSYLSKGVIGESLITPCCDTFCSQAELTEPNYGYAELIVHLCFF